MSDYYEDLAHEFGDPNRTRYLSEDEEEDSMPVYSDLPRRKPLTEDDIVNRAPNIYEGPLKSKPPYDVPLWVVVAVVLVFFFLAEVLVAWLR